MTNNPLLSPSTLPNYAPHFDQIKIEHYVPAVKQGIKEAKENVESIKNNQEAPNFENVIVALERASETLDNACAIFYNQLSSMGGDELHALTQEIGPLKANFSTDIALDSVLFKKIKAVYDQKNSLSLTEEQNTLLENTYIGFVRGGALLEGEDKETLRNLNEKMSMLGPQFMENVSKSAESFELVITDKADLSGLPESAIDNAAQAAEDKGYKDSWLITLDYPSFGPFVQFSKKRDLREKVWRAFSNRAFEDDYDNCETLLSIINLRDQRAKLLGYKTHADFVLERRMAKTPQTVLGFLERCKDIYKPAALKDLAELKSYANALDNLAEEDFRPWDFAYYSEKLKQEKFSFSSEDLRPYFQLDKVLKGVFDHFSALFDIRFEEAKEKYAAWHKDVTVFELFDNKDNSFIGTLYADFYPRTGKKPGAWMTSYRDQGLFNGTTERSLTAIVCNFTKPTKDKPSLITHGEVRTLFHEMGHAIHNLLSKCTYQSTSGTNVLWDFVELPSQIQENWIYEPETLNRFATHYKTGEKIPEELIKKLNEAKNFMAGYMGLRQTNFGILDMAWHTNAPSTIKDVAEFEDNVTQDLSLFPRYAGPASTAFNHIFAGGYSAGYYSYKWAEALDADAFETFKEGGLYNQETAKRYRNEILAKGGSSDPAELYKAFKGRDPDPEALFRREDLID